MSNSGEDVIPTHLYKYYGEALWLFPNPTLRYTPVPELNDPYEVLPVVEPQFSAKALKKMGKSSGIQLSHKQLKRLSREANQELKQNASYQFADLCKKYDII